MHHLETLAETGSKGRGLTAPALFMPAEFPRMSLLGSPVNLRILALRLFEN